MMTLIPSDLELFFLDDNDIPINDQTLWADYRANLIWRKWGTRPTNTGSVGVPPSSPFYADDPNINDDSIVGSMPIYFLRGKYINTIATSGNAPGDNMNKDYIVASADVNLAGHPLYQYTWIAIQNRNTTGDSCLRFGCSSGQLPDSWSNSVPNVLDSSINTTSVRWMGLLDGSDEATLTSFKSAHALFPHKVDLQQRDSAFALISAYNWWDAMGAATAGKKVFYGHNNLFSYNLTTEHYPWQIASWMQRSSTEAPPNRQEHCMDIPAGKTLVGIFAISKDGQQDQNGSASISMEALSNFGWKYAEVDCKYDYLVIS